MWCYWECCSRAPNCHGVSVLQPRAHCELYFDSTHPLATPVTQTIPRETRDIGCLSSLASSVIDEILKLSLKRVHGNSLTPSAHHTWPKIRLSNKWLDRLFRTTLFHHSPPMNFHQITFFHFPLIIP